MTLDELIAIAAAQGELFARKNAYTLIIDPKTQTVKGPKSGIGKSFTKATLVVAMAEIAALEAEAGK